MKQVVVRLQVVELDGDSVYEQPTETDIYKGEVELEPGYFNIDDMKVGAFNKYNVYIDNCKHDDYEVEDGYAYCNVCGQDVTNIIDFPEPDYDLQAKEGRN